MTLSEEVQETDASTIYYGSVTGMLDKTNDYALYPVTLSANQYLQVRLTLPNDNQLDYDLLLYDSNLSLIKYSDYITCTNGAGTLEEAVGYIAKSNEKLYVCVYSTAGGSTEEYTLDYTITTNFSDTTEPDDNAKEATTLSLGKAGANVSKMINSPLDNDWYTFEVIDDFSYDKIRLNIASDSSANGCKVELYRNVVSNYYAMQFIGSGTGGEIELAAGTYFLRVVSTNTFENFNAGDIPTYELSVTPVSKVDTVTISTFKGKNNALVEYPEGKYIRIDRSDVNVVTVCGRATYVDSNGEEKGAANVIVNGEILDKQWEENNRPDMAKVYGTAVTDVNGYYNMKVNLMTPLGGLKYNAPISVHHYDFMIAKVTAENNENAKGTNYFYYLRMSVPY